MSDSLSLPEEVLEFLRAGEALDYDPSEHPVPGPAWLIPLAELQVEELKICAPGTYLELKDPHRGEEGHYLVKGVHLVDTRDYRKGCLVWFPDYRAFGCWDDDHKIGHLFEEISWQRIVNRPAQYLRAQWDPGQPFVGELWPWRYGEWVPITRRYRPGEDYAEGEWLEHPTFGRGQIVSVGATRIQVEFEDARRTLVR